MLSQGRFSVQDSLYPMTGLIGHSSWGIQLYMLSPDRFSVRTGQPVHTFYVWMDTFLRTYYCSYKSTYLLSALTRSLKIGPLKYFRQEGSRRIISLKQSKHTLLQDNSKSMIWKTPISIITKEGKETIKVKCYVWYNQN